MDERRDLVDREELRRLFERNTGAGYSYSWSAANRKNLAFLDAMPAVECPRGWTRDEVLHELDTHPGAACEWRDPYNGNWYPTPLYRVKEWHPEVRRYDVRVVLPKPPATVWVPLTKLVGRTLPGETEAVCRYEGYSEGVLWFPTESAARAKDITVFDESGRVEVLAATIEWRTSGRPSSGTEVHAPDELRQAVEDAIHAAEVGWRSALGTTRRSAP
jgi:hypothetical protein